jgi:WD40 repeat protein
LLTWGARQPVRLWDADSGEPLWRLEGRASDVRTAALSPDGRRFAAGGRIFDTATGKLTAEVARRPDDVRCAAFSLDGRFVLIGGNSDRAVLADAETGNEVRRFEGHAADWIEHAAFSPDGEFVLTADFGFVDSGTRSTVRVLHVPTGDPAGRLTIDGRVGGAAFAPDGRTIAIAAQGLVILWDRATGQTTGRLQCCHRAFAVAFSPADGRLLIGGTLAQDDDRGDVDGAVLVEPRTGRIVQTFGARVAETTAMPVFSPDGRRFLTAVGADTVVWDGPSGRPLSVLPTAACARFSADGRQVLLQGARPPACLYDVGSGRCLGTHPGGFELVAVDLFGPPPTAPDRRRLTVSGASARLTDASTGRLIAAFGYAGERLGVYEYITGAALSPDGRRLLITGAEGVVRLHDAEDGRELCRLHVLSSGDWAVTDLAGRYDGPNGGDVTGLHWVMGDGTTDLSRFRRRFHEPGLLAGHMGWDRRPLRKVD